MLLAFLLIACMFSLQIGAREGSPISFNLEEQRCFIQKEFKSPMVVGYKRDLSCGQEGTDYHMVFYSNKPPKNVDENLGNDDDVDDDDGDGDLETIKVAVRPDNNQTYLGTLVIVLSSTRRVSWKLKFQRVSEDAVVHLWISGHSRVLKESQRRMGIRHLPYFKSTNELKRRMRSEFSNVKFTQSTVRNRMAVVKIVTGDRRCLIKPSVPVQLDGCVAPWSVDISTMRYVYVIEVIDPNPDGDLWSSPDDPTPVYINLHPKNGRSMKVHVQLVLRSTKPTNWILQANKLKGILDLIAEHRGDNSEVNLKNSRFVSERLSHLSGEELIDWVSEQYHAPVAYVRAVGANSFDISVDSDLATFEPPSELMDGLEDNLVVDCQDGSLKIFLLPHMLLTEDKLFLSEEMCPATKVDEILWWNVTQDQCGTVKEVNDTFHNLLFIGGAFESWMQLPVRCELSNLATYVNDPKNPDYTMSVYADINHLNRFVSFPLRTHLRQNYYITASVEDHRVRVRLDSCEATSQGTPAKVETLISNGCPVSKMIRMSNLPNFLTGHESFDLIYNNLDSSNVFDVHCNVSLCIRSHRVSVAGLEQCHSKWKRSCRFSFPSSSPINHIVSKTYLTPPITTVHVGPFEGPKGGDVDYTSRFEGDEFDNDEEEDDKEDDYQEGVYMPPLPPPLKDHITIHHPLPKSNERPGAIPPSIDCEINYQPANEGLVGITTVVCIAFAAFAIGVLLIGALWFIHSRTGPRKKKANPSTRCVPRPLHTKCADSNQGTLTNQVCCPGFNNA